MTYASKQDLLDRDESAVWNMAMDREVNALDDTAIDSALEQASEEIDSFLAKKFVLPLETVPKLLNRLAVTLAFYWLADSCSQATELVEKRYEAAIVTLKELAAGKRYLALPELDAALKETTSGKVTLLQERERMMTRGTLGRVL